MKKLFVSLLVLLSVFMLHAETYEVVTVIGKVSYEKAGKWKTVKAGDKVSDEWTFKIEENSSITLNVSEKRVTLRGPLSNVLADLLKSKTTTKKTTAKTSVQKGTTADTTKKATKGVATASSRASESQGATILDEE
ncbi:MAG: hypothetical protein MJ176_04925 [Treponema sp.]|nr:hypothetical protein [Treponema sp.]